jgi:hypothetical protein
MSSSSNYLGIKKLTDEQMALLESATKDSLFGRHGTLGLDNAAESHRRARGQQYIQPYADAFLEFLKTRVTNEKRSLYEDLKKNLFCNIYNYSTISYHQTLLNKNRALEEMPLEERVAFEETLEKDLPPETTLGMRRWIEDEDDGSYYASASYRPVKMHRIVRSPGFLTRVALLFGPKFTASITHDSIAKKDGMWGWTHNIVTIRVTYKGDSILPYQVNQMLKVLADDMKRERFTLSDIYWLYGEAFSEKPLPKPGKPLQEHGFAYVPAYLSGTGRDETVRALHFQGMY